MGGGMGGMGGMGMGGGFGGNNFYWAYDHPTSHLKPIIYSASMFFNVNFLK
jgi:hypothetical protein